MGIQTSNERKRKKTWGGKRKQVTARVVFIHAPHAETIPRESSREKQLLLKRLQRRENIFCRHRLVTSTRQTCQHVGLSWQITGWSRYRFGRKCGEDLFGLSVQNTTEITPRALKDEDPRLILTRRLVFWRSGIPWSDRPLPLWYYKNWLCN